MKRIIYTLLALVSCLALSCKKEVLNVPDFGKVIIDSVSPGSTPSGAHVVVYGKNFAYLPEDVKVKINQLEGQVIEASLSRLVILLPEGATTGALQFDFDRKNPTNEQFDYSGQVQSSAAWPSLTINNSLVALPIIKNVAPHNGKAGDVITITGYNFSSTSNPSVLFGDVAGEVTSIAGNELKVKVPVTTPEMVRLKVQQGSNNADAGTFQVDETPKGVKEIYFAQSNGVNQICKATFDDLGNPTIQVLYDASDGVSAPDLGIKADAANNALYWIDGPWIMKGSTDGALPPVAIYTDNAGVADLDIAAGKLYFTSFSSSVSGSHSIKRINADGTGTAEELYLLPGDPTPIGLKVNAAGAKLYWVDLNSVSVYEGSLNGQAAQPVKVLFEPSDGIGGPFNIAISTSTSKIFITDLGIGGIFVGSLDGTGILNKLPIPVADLVSPMDLEIDDVNGSIYWLNQNGENSSIMRAKTDGSNLQRMIPNIKYGYFFDLVF
jgi:hypothetical protein